MTFSHNPSISSGKAIPDDSPSPTPNISNGDGKLDFLVRFGHMHESFRLAELKAVAEVTGVDMEVVSYSPLTPFTHIRLPSHEAAQAIISRSILAQSIHELWGHGTSLAVLHQNVRTQSSHLFEKYGKCTFRFQVDSFQNSRTKEEHVALIDGFSFVGFTGKIRMRDPDETYTIFEEWEFDRFQNVPGNGTDGKDGDQNNRTQTYKKKRPKRSSSVPSSPNYIWFGRLVGHSSREQVNRFDLKKRAYISTTSMDAELTLVTANLSLASAGKMFYDPFVGTGSFPLAAAHFGALVFGSDIDGRALRGAGGWTGGVARKQDRCLAGNFDQYGLRGRLGDVWIADLVNSPVRLAAREGVAGGKRFLDGIICDPPYGVREGLRVLGRRNPPVDPGPVLDSEGVETYKKPNFIHPKRPYSFSLMLHDILTFSHRTLVDNGRLSFWMPTANEPESDVDVDTDTTTTNNNSDSLTGEIPIPTHPGMEVMSVCTQPFNKWSRRLITYKRLRCIEVDQTKLDEYDRQMDEERSQERIGRLSGGGEDGCTVRVVADELNPFRKAYFTGFE